MNTQTMTDDERVAKLTETILAGDRGDAPGSPYGTRATEWAPVAALLHLVTSYATGEGMDDPDALRSAVSLVVNGSDDVAYTLVNYEHELDGTVDVADYLYDGERVTCGSCEALNWTADRAYDVCSNCLQPLA